MPNPRGRPPKPTALHELHGAPGHSKPKPGRSTEPKPTKVVGLAPPALLSKEAKNEWFRLTAEFERLGMMTVVDLGALAAYCVEWSVFLDATADINRRGILVKDADGTRRRNPAVMVLQSSIQAMLPLWSRFGMTPGDRPRLGKPAGSGETRPPNDPASPGPTAGSFDDLLAGRPDETAH